MDFCNLWQYRQCFSIVSIMGNYLPLQFTHPGDSKHSPVTDSSFKQTWLDNESISVTIDDNEDVLFDVTNVSPSPCPQISMDRFGAAAGGPPIFSPQPGYPPIDTNTCKITHHTLDFKDIAERLPNIQSDPAAWESAILAEVESLSLNTRDIRDLITKCVPKSMSHQITLGAELNCPDGFPFLPSQSLSHQEAFNKMIENAKKLERANTDLTFLTKTKQKQGENVTEFIHRYKTQFDLHSGFTKQQKGYTNLFNLLLTEAIHPHLKQAIKQDPLWETKTLDHIIALAEYHDTHIEPPKPRPKIKSVTTPEGHVKFIHSPHEPTRGESGACRQQGQPGAWNTGIPPHILYASSPSIQSPQARKLDYKTIQCFSCGEFGHTQRQCYHPNPDLPFKK